MLDIPIGNKNFFQLGHDPYIISAEVVVKKVFPIGQILEFLLSPFLGVKVVLFLELFRNISVNIFSQFAYV